MERIKQYIGPFSANDSLELISSTKCKIGVSISEKDFMKRGNPNLDNQVILKIENKKNNNITIVQNEIQIGKTFIYQPGDALEKVTLSFPKGAPDSIIIDVVYMS